MQINSPDNVTIESTSSKTRTTVFKKQKSKIKDLKKEVEIDEHKLSLDELAERFKTDLKNGLTQAQASELLEKNGPNSLTPPKKVPEWLKFLKQMTGGFSILLWIGAAFSLIAYFIQNSSSKDNLWLAIVLAFVVFITGCFQYYQEFKSGKIMDSFKNMLPEQTLVFRDGQRHTISAKSLVLGDLVQIDIGSRIPADMRIIKCSGLKVDNSSLTGEAEALSRSPELTHDNPLETKNLIFFGTYAVEGSAIGVVIRTGDNTAMGRIASLTANIETEQTHLAQEMAYFIKIVTFVAFTFGITFFLVSIGSGYAIIESVVFLIGVVIANVPEGLMACLTVCLALTAERMAKKNCLVKRLETVEALGLYWNHMLR